jgi:hypothetical protein
VPGPSLVVAERTKQAVTNAGPQPTIRRTVVERYGSRSSLPVPGEGIRKTKAERERDARRG